MAARHKGCFGALVVAEAPWRVALDVSGLIDTKRPLRMSARSNARECRSDCVGISTLSFPAEFYQIASTLGTLENVHSI
jgi:hypothetical protein